MKASHLSVKRGQKVVLEDINLSLVPGQLLAVVGPNGAGKSTLLSCLAGSLFPSEGTCTLDGTAMRNWPTQELAKRRAVLTQNTHLTFAFSVLDVVLMGRWTHCKGRPGRGDRRLARRALERVGAWELRERKITDLSGGEQQRVHLARCLCQLWDGDGQLKGSQYLLLDEPTSNLDPSQSHRSFQLFRSLAQEGISILVVAHDLGLCLQYADRALLLKGGEAQYLGIVEHPDLHPALEACFDIRLQVLSPQSGDRPIFVTLGPKEANSHCAVSGKEILHGAERCA